MTGTWFFGEPAARPGGTPATTKYILSVVLVYGGLLLLDARVAAPRGGDEAPRGGAAQEALVDFSLWAVPMIVAPPLFCRDVFSYAAQGEMTAYHISPYLYGPYTLGSSPYFVARGPAVVEHSRALRTGLPLDRRDRSTA